MHVVSAVPHLITCVWYLVSGILCFGSRVLSLLASSLSWRSFRNPCGDLLFDARVPHLPSHSSLSCFVVASSFSAPAPCHMLTELGFCFFVTTSFSALASSNYLLKNFLLLRGDLHLGHRVAHLVLLEYSSRHCSWSTSQSIEFVQQGFSSNHVAAPNLSLHQGFCTIPSLTWFLVAPRLIWLFFIITTVPYSLGVEFSQLTISCV